MFLKIILHILKIHTTLKPTAICIDMYGYFLLYEFTLLSNNDRLIRNNTTVFPPYEFTLLSNPKDTTKTFAGVFPPYEFTLLSNNT